MKRGKLLLFTMVMLGVLLTAGTMFADLDNDLSVAAYKTNFAEVKRLVSKGADPLAKNNLGYTVLHWAALSGNVEMVKYLVSKGADPLAKSKYNSTVLHSAALSGNFEMVKYLVSKGADPRAKNTDGLTVLHNAARRGNFKMVKYLVGKGADPLAKDELGKTVLHWAAWRGNLNTVKYLVSKGADVNEKFTYSGETSLHYAARNGNLKMVKYLVSKGADVNAKFTYTSDTVLHSAASSGNLDTVKYLMSKGADVNAKTDEGWTILHYAASSGNLDTVKYLVSKGADPLAKNNDGSTVLHSAADGGNLEMVKYLVGKGLDPLAKNTLGRTVLHFAAYSGNLEMVKYLVSKGADPFTKLNSGSTVLHSAAYGGNLEMVKYLVGKGLDVNAKSNDGWTVLHSATWSGNLDMVQYLVSKGADPLAKNKYGKTAEDNARAYGYTKIVVFLQNPDKYLKPSKPTILTLTAKPNMGPSKILKAKESGEIVLSIANKGKGEGKNLKISLNKISGCEGISFDIPDEFSISQKKTKKLTIEITASKSVASGYAIFELQIKEPHFKKHSQKVKVKIQTQEFLKPVLVVHDWGIDDDQKGESYGDGDKTAKEGENIEVEVVIANTGAGKAKSVKITPKVYNKGGGIVYFGDEKSYDLGTIDAGEWRKIKLPISIGNDLTSRKATVKLTITEAEGDANFTKSINFTVGKRKAVTSEVVVKRGDITIKKTTEIKDAPTLRVDVDVRIPAGWNPYGKKSMAIVIGNRDYKNVFTVDYAINDASTMKKYFIKRLYVPKENIIYRENTDLTTLNDIFGLKGMQKKSRCYRQAQRIQPKVLYVYYSGHGVPGLKNKKGYLAPVNTIKDNVETTAYPMELMYDTLVKIRNELGVKKIYVIIDACFSGDSPGGMLIENVSPIIAKVNNPVLLENSGAVFLATSSDDYATWYKDKRHGTFTYFFLKGLRGAADKNKDRKITVGEMRKYISLQVPRRANIEVGIEQKPEIKGKSSDVILTY